MIGNFQTNGVVRVVTGPSQQLISEEAIEYYFINFFLNQSYTYLFITYEDKEEITGSGVFYCRLFLLCHNFYLPGPFTFIFPNILPTF